MPNIPPRACGTCGRPNCTQHRRSAFSNAQAVRIRGRQLQGIRARLFQHSPLCALCLVHGRCTVATIRDHITPLAEGGTDTEANTQALCVECHDAKSEAEAKRGVTRWSRP